MILSTYPDLSQGKLLLSLFFSMVNKRKSKLKESFYHVIKMQGEREEVQKSICMYVCIKPNSSRFLVLAERKKDIDNNNLRVGVVTLALGALKLAS